VKKLSHHTITGIIHCLSGLRVGGSDDLLQIGGTDLTCIKHPITLKPYIPGSSLKGRMRSEMERRFGKFSKGRDGLEPCNCKELTCPICRVFGPHKQPRHELGPTRIIVRDAPVRDGGELELKPENVIERGTGRATNPRKVERVVAGSKFRLRIALQVFDLDLSWKYTNLAGAEYSGRDALIAFLKDALREVQNTGIGSGLSKGSGEIEFLDLKLDGEPFDP
jgi:CRISPR-associated protein Csm3